VVKRREIFLPEIKLKNEVVEAAENPPIFFILPENQNFCSFPPRLGKARLAYTKGRRGQEN
jgi:hypothetical protein